MDLRDKLRFWIALSSYVDMIVRGTSPLSLPDAIADSLSYVKAFGGTEQRNLPDDYIERQFIYMMDGSYLLTDIVPTPDCKIEFDFQTLTIASGARTYLGCRDSSGSNDGLRVAHISSGNFRIYGFGTYADSATAIQANTRYKFVWNNKQATITTGGTTVFDNTFAAERANQTAVAINGWNTAGTVDANSEGMYLYSFKVWNGQGELVANYVPAVQKGTVPVVGFYDTVSGTFKTATSGTFAAGGEAVPTPDKPMDIVSNNGVLKYGNVSKNLFDEDYPNVSNSMKYLAIYLGPGKYTCSYSLPHMEGGTSMVYFLNGNVSSGASNNVNQVDASTSRTITTSTGYITIAYRNGSGIALSGEVPSDYNCMLEQGQTATPYEPYRLAVYTDGTVETINMHSKNLFDEQWTRNTGVSTQTATWGQVVTASGWSTSGLVPVKAGQQYTVSYNTTVQIYVFYYESDGTMQSSYDTASATKKTFTVPAGATHIRLQVNKSTEAAIADLEAQLETGATATDYEPYYNGGTAVAEMLLKAGTYQDVQSIIDGAVSRSVGVKVLDGSENIGKSSQYNGSFFVRNVVTDWGTSNNAQVYCSHFSGVTAESSYAQNKCMILNNAFNMWWASDNTPTLAQFKQWLADQSAAGTPVIIVYPLATPTTESVTGQTLQVQEGNNILEITQASMDGLELEASYKKGA